MTRPLVGRTLGAALLLVLGAASLRAQGAGASPERRPVPPGTDSAASPPAPLAVLQRQLRQAMARMARTRLGLDDAQMARLTATNRRFEQQRREILREERETRVALRTAVLDSTSPDQRQIADYMDQLFQLQRRRVDVLEAEQQELATFLSPLQRAKYMALQEQVRRRIEQLRRQHAQTDVP